MVQVLLSRRLIRPAFVHKVTNSLSSPLLCTLQNINQLYHKITQEPSSATFKTAKNTKCLKVTLTTISTAPAIPILPTMFRITLRQLTRSRRFWLGYLYSNPQYSTTTFKPIEPTGLVTGYYKLRNIRIGLQIFLVNLTVQPCFSMEVRGLERPTLGKGEDTRGKRSIANKPWC